MRNQQGCVPKYPMLSQPVVVPFSFSKGNSVISADVILQGGVVFLHPASKGQANF